MIDDQLHRGVQPVCVFPFIVRVESFADSGELLVRDVAFGQRDFDRVFLVLVAATAIAQEMDARGVNIFGDEFLERLFFHLSQVLVESRSRSIRG